MSDIMRDPRINNYNHFSKAGISSSFSGPLTGDITGTLAPRSPEEAKEGWWGRAGCSREASAFRKHPQNLGLSSLQHHPKLADCHHQLFASL